MQNKLSSNQTCTRARASWLQVIFLFFPVIVIVMSSILPNISNRTDDIVFVMLFFILLYALLVYVFLIGKCNHSNYRLLAISIIIIFPLVAWIMHHGSGYTGLWYGILFIAFFFMPIVALYKSRLSQFQLNSVVKVSILFYISVVLVLFSITNIDNDEFLRISSININNVFLPILPAVALWARRIIFLHKSDILIASVFLISVLLTGSKQTILIGFVLLAVAMRKQFKTYKWLIITAFVAFFFIVVPKGSWLDDRFAQLGMFLMGDWEAIPSVVNRLSLWDVYVDAFFHNWIMGYGMGNTYSAFIYSAPSIDMSSKFMEIYHTPHNSYLRLLVEGGVVLLCGVILLHVIIVVGLFTHYKRYASLDIFCVLLLSVFINAMLTEVLYSWVYWAALSQMVVLGRISTTSLQARNPIIVNS